MSLSTIKHAQAHALEIEEATITQGHNKQIRWLVTGLYADTIHVHILDRTLLYLPAVFFIIFCPI
jgi:hypothetical protein